MESVRSINASTSHPKVAPYAKTTGWLVDGDADNLKERSALFAKLTSTWEPTTNATRKIFAAPSISKESASLVVKTISLTPVVSADRSCPDVSTRISNASAALLLSSTLRASASLMAASSIIIADVLPVIPD